MKSFWFNEDEIHRGRNRLRWLRIYWSRRLDIDYHGVTRLSPASSQWEGPTSDLTLRRMNSEVHTLFRTPSMPPPLPPHSGTIRHTYILFQWFGAKCEKRRAHRYHGISMKVKTFYRRLYCGEKNLDVRFKNSAGFVQQENYFLKSDFLINNTKRGSITLV